VANDFAVAGEMAQLAPEAITLVRDTHVGAYREAVVNATSAPAPPSAFDSIIEQRSPGAIASRYLGTLRAAARKQPVEA
jgi:hypothetical protein